MRTLAIVLLLAATARADVFNMPAGQTSLQFVTVGDPGNAPDTTGFGAVPYGYRISKYEVTNAQYVQFLNAKDPTGANTLNLYAIFDGPRANNGVNRTLANANGSKYSVVPGRGNDPANYISWYDAIRFANWLNNGQGNGDTETGAYTLGPLGFPGGDPFNGNSIVRKAGAQIFLPSENEWYKAAYYDAVAASYFLYPTRSNAPPTASFPSASPNSANYSPGGPNDVTDVGAYTGSESYYGTLDQAGNVWEWNEALLDVSSRGRRGGSFLSFAPSFLRSSAQYESSPAGGGGGDGGFRVAAVPEPSTLILASIGLVIVRRMKKPAA